MEQKESKLFQEHKNAAGRMEEAYIRLLARKPYLDITVSDVVKEAGVARVSFYRSFQSLADMLDRVLDDFYADLTQDILPAFQQDRESAWRKLLLHTYQGIRSGTHSLKFLPENSTYLLNAVYRKFDLRTAVETMSTEQKYIPVINLQTMFVCAKVWMDTGMKETPEELAEFALRIIRQNTALIRD